MGFLRYQTQNYNDLKSNQDLSMFEIISKLSKFKYSQKIRQKFPNFYFSQLQSQGQKHILPFQKSLHLTCLNQQQQKVFFQPINFFMDDLFLYNHIKQAIKQRKKLPNDTQEGNFAQNYCRRQLMKKKLNLNNSNSHNGVNKMKSLMKNFSHVETYVDLNELLFSINLMRSKQLEERKISKVQEKHRHSRILRLQDIQKLNTLSHFAHATQSPQPDAFEALKDKVRGQIGDMIKKKYQQQNTGMDQVIEYLQKESYMNNSLLKNNSTNYISYLNQQLQKIQRDQDTNTQNNADNAKIFKLLTQTLSQPQYQKQTKKQYFKSTSLNSKQKKQENQLLHKISTFLQIALENQHKQKWATKEMKKFRSTHGSFRFKKNKEERSKFFLKGIDLENQNKEVFENIKETPKPFVKRDQSKKNSYFMKKIKSQTRNIFGKKSLEKDNADLTQFSNFGQGTKSNWLQSSFPKSVDSKQSTSLFKAFQNDAKMIETRNTAPVDPKKFIEDFNQSFKNRFQTTEEKQKQNVFPGSQGPSIFMLKKYQLNKGRRNREYDFISPIRKNYEYKTVIIDPHRQNFQIDANKTCDQVIMEKQGTIQNKKKSTEKGLNTITNLTKCSTLPSTSSSQFLNKSHSTLTRSPTLSQTFTFKKRNKKQQILNKLESFIQEVNHQQKQSKLQNEYYDSAINHLHDLSKTAYKNYQPEALAGQQEISELKKFVNGINPSMRKNHSKTGGGNRKRKVRDDL